MFKFITGASWFYPAVIAIGLSVLGGTYFLGRSHGYDSCEANQAEILREALEKQKIEYPKTIEEAAKRNEERNEIDERTREVIRYVYREKDGGTCALSDDFIRVFNDLRSPKDTVQPSG